MPGEIIHVTSQTDIARGEKALERLAQTNDSRFQNPDGSVTKVDDARWRTAQEYERSTWLDHNPQATDDRNMTHADAFGGYKVLPKALGDVVELGCGVFTNLRFLLQDHHAKSVTLVDPLIDEYKAHANCTYKDGTLYGQDVTSVTSAIEDWQTEEQFDTVVMINVLHHCKDADAVLDTIRRILKTGGWLVFHEPPREIDPLRHYDAGHPLSPTANYLENFLAEFDEEYRQNWYFIGRKPSVSVGKPVTAEEAATLLPAEVKVETKPAQTTHRATPAKKTPARKPTMKRAGAKAK